MITVIAGGVGSARFLAGLVQVVDPASLTVVVNTGDDESVRGLHVSPDIDTVLYHLAGLSDWDRGWGICEETFVCDQRYRDLASKLPDCGTDLQEWFSLGDRDLATNLLRARLLDSGMTLTQATDGLRRAMSIGCRVLPMSDDPVRTVFTTAAGEALDFQEYFVRRGASDEIAAVTFKGADRAAPAPGVLEAVADCEVLIFPPSNPLISTAPPLAVPGMREAVAAARARRVGVSPIVGGRALKGPADRLLASLGHEVSPAGVARIYAGLLDVFVVDERDAGAAPGVEAAGMRAVLCDTVMRSAEDAARLAKTVLEVAA
ncbi:MAG TPA: 2-phospho-L-lactate transferase [Actinomycetota bacterium]|nr:2-phospho-L-lactate transferase [Actinomycetota bacterium]